MMRAFQFKVQCLAGLLATTGRSALIITGLLAATSANAQTSGILGQTNGITTLGAGPSGGGGSVSSVAFTGPSGLTVSGSPITGSGTISLTAPSLIVTQNFSQALVLSNTLGIDAASALSISNVTASTLLRVNAARQVAAVTVGSGLSFDGTTLTSSPLSDGGAVHSFTTNYYFNSLATNSLYSVSVPANAMGTNLDLWVHIGGYYTNNSGSASALSFFVSYGTTRIYESSIGATIASQTAVRPLWLDLHFQNTGSTGQQYLSGLLSIGSGSAAPGPGIGTGPGINAVYIIYPIAAYGAVDSTVTKTFDVSAQVGSASASIGIAAVAAYGKIQ